MPLTSLYRSLSPAESIGFAAFFSAFCLGWADILLATVPLTLFLLFCAAAPFLTRFGFFLPVISRGTSGLKAVALTFDDGPHPLSTPLILDMLSRYGFRAAFFVNGKRVLLYPELIRRILAEGHLIGNHTFTHDNFILFKGQRRLTEEIEATQAALKPFGITPLMFRPPVGITNPGLKAVMEKTGMEAVTFRFRPGDRGNRSVRNLSEGLLCSMRPDDLLLLHDIAPKNPDVFQVWLRELERLMAGIRKKGYEVLPLDRLIKRPVMAINRKKTETEGREIRNI